MILESSIRYRDPESERALVEILEDTNARDAFLKDREGYLSRFNLLSNAKIMLLSMPTEQIISATNEYYQNVVGISSYDETCASTTFADVLCDE